MLHAAILLVKSSVLPETPVAFQQYVAEHFVAGEIFGVSICYAFEVLSRKKYFHGIPGVKQAIAPRHMLDLSNYTEGLHGEHLSVWIKRAITDGTVKCLRAEWTVDSLADFLHD